MIPLTLLIFALVGCSDDHGTDMVLLPANLDFTISQSGQNGSTIDIVAQSDNTNFYRFDFGDGSEIAQQNSGGISHTYSNTGMFTITVQAHATVTDFISDSKVISVTAPDPTSMGYESPESYEGYGLVWQDEFNGADLSDDWSYEYGGDGWGNNELENYKKENTHLENGFLYITAKKEAAGGQQYTSSRLITKGHQEFTYGRIDIRAILPKGQGIWPALWMLGSDIDEIGWPGCGELDIMELIGGGSGRDDKMYGTIHWEDGGQHASYGGNTQLSGGIFADEFHVFSIIWDDQKISWLLDNEVFHEADITPEDLEEFHKDFFVIFNVAVGGDWPGNPDDSTQFPQQMIVDYIRVFQPS